MKAALLTVWICLTVPKLASKVNEKPYNFSNEQANVKNWFNPQENFWLRQNLHNIFPCTMKTLVVRGVSLHLSEKSSF